MVLVPSEPRRERSDLYKIGTSNESGTVHFSSVAPGDYKVFAWDNVPVDAGSMPTSFGTMKIRERSSEWLRPEGSASPSV